ncbi:MAG: hypothetical protein RR220_07970 [Bacteroidaceae bacterium]
MKITKISLKAGIYAHICPLCGEIKASGSDICSLPEFSICDCDRNGNKQEVYELFERAGEKWIRRNKFPRFIGRITFGALSDIDDVEVLDECTDLELAKSMRKAGEFLNKKKGNVN